jgi:hypothetical protein
LECSVFLPSGVGVSFRQFQKFVIPKCVDTDKVCHASTPQKLSG